MYLSPSLFWDVTWPWLIYGYLRCLTTFRLRLPELSSLLSEVEAVEEYCLTLECRANTSCRKVSDLLPTYASQHPQTTEVLQYAAVEPTFL
jgi:hypothetical protein